MRMSNKVSALCFSMVCIAFCADSGLVAHWTFDEGSGTVLNDISGNGHNGAISGATYVTGISGDALNFDGVEDYCSVPDHNDLTGMSQLSVEAWVYPNADISVNYTPIVSKWIEVGNSSWALLLTTGNYPRLGVTGQSQSGVDEMKMTSSTAVPIQQWSHIVGVYDGSDIRLYVNGEETAIQSSDYRKIGSGFTLFDNIEPVRIGGCPTSPENKYFDGQIDEVRILNTALTSEDVLARYNLYKPDAPTNLSYTPNSITYTVGQVITTPNEPTVTGTVTNYSVSPDLPAGLEIDATEGVIYGTPTTVTEAGSYTVTASNPYGNTTCVITITVNAAVTLPFSDDFADGTDSEWIKPEGGTWLVQDGVYHRDTSAFGVDGHEISYVGGSSWTDYTVSVDAKTRAISKGWATLVFRVLDEGTYYTFQIEPATNTAKLEKRTNHSAYVIQSSTQSLEANTYYELKAEVQGDSVTCYLNGSVVFVQGGLDILSGGAGLAGWHMPCDFDNFAATEISSANQPPSNLTYTSLNAAYTVNQAIQPDTPSVSGNVDSYSVSPTLPSGLSIHPTTGIISGTPTNASGATVYTIIAANAYGSDSTEVEIEVQPVQLGSAPEIVPVTPDPTTDLTPLFSWVAVSGASDYRVIIDDDGGFAAPLVTAQSGGATSYTPTTDLPLGTIYWKVASSVDNYTLFSSVDTFDIVSAFVPETLARWTFDSASATTFYDMTGNGHHLVATGLSRSEGVVDSALDCSGASFSTAVLESDSAFAPGMISIEGWIYPSIDLVEPESYNRTKTILSMQELAGSITHGYSLQVNDSGYLQLLFGGATNSVTCVSSTKIKPHRWYHVAGTYDGDTMKVYVDGVPGVSVTNSAGYGAPSSNATIGCKVVSGVVSEQFAGRIDELSVYNYALSGLQVQTRYNAVTPPNQTAPFAIQVATKTVFTQAGEEIWVPVYLANHERYLISSCSFSLVFDTTVARFVEATIDSGMASSWRQLFDYNANAQDSVFFAMGGEKQTLGYGATGELLRCKFVVQPGLSSDSYTDLTISGLSIDEDNDLVTASTLSGKIVIGGSGINYGDVSGNQEVTVYDASKILQYVVGSLPLPDPDVPNFTFEVADVSGNGTISSYDAALVFQHSVGLIDLFPVQLPTLNKRANSMSTASLDLVQTTGPQGGAVFQIVGQGISGLIAGEFAIEFDPASATMSRGEVSTTIPGANLKVKLDDQANTLKLALMTTDDIDDDDPVVLATIALPPLSGTNVAPLTLEKVLLNEGAIATNYPADGLNNEEQIPVHDPKAMRAVSSRQPVEVRVTPSALVLVDRASRGFDATICNLEGRTVMSCTHNGISSQAVRLETGHMPSGAYVIRVFTGGKAYTTPIVVRK